MKLPWDVDIVNCLIFDDLILIEEDTNHIEKVNTECRNFITDLLIYRKMGDV